MKEKEKCKWQSSSAIIVQRKRKEVNADPTRRNLKQVNNQSNPSLTLILQPKAHYFS
jgi:hypothetical protein